MATVCPYLIAVCLGKLSWDLSLKSHPEDWRSLTEAGIESATPVYKASGVVTALRKLK